MKKLIIIPAYNEEASIGAVLSSLDKYADSYDFIVINDASTDNTRSIVKKNNGRIIDLPVNLGIGGAVQTGYIYAKENGYDIAIQMDGDGQHDPEYLSALVSPLEAGECDITIGSRFLNSEGFQSSAIRRFGISFLNWLIHLFTKITVTDATSGFRAVNKKGIDLYSRYYPQDYPEPEAIVIAARTKKSIKEIPVRMKSRMAGHSSISPLRSLYYMIKVSLAIIISNITGIIGGYDL